MERFWVKVDKTDTCWLWTAYINQDGYGSFWDWRVPGMVGAHRFAWILEHGPVLNDLEVDHLCKVRHCVNPAHMELVTHAENVRRGRRFQAEKTHCPQGHLYDDRNTYLHRGKRGCRVCRRDAVRRYARKKRLNTQPLSTAASTSPLATGPSD